MATLGYKHRLFIHHYLETTKNDEVKAARLAGFANPKVRGPQLLASPKVAAYLEAKLEESGAMPVAEILARWSAIASADLMDFVDIKEEVDKNGVKVNKAMLNVAKIKKTGNGHLIKEMKLRNGEVVEVSFHSSVEASDKLAKFNGLFKERIEITNVGDSSSERVVAILGGLAQLAGAINAGAGGGQDEPRALCGDSEQWEVDAGPALEVDQPTPALAGPEGDRPAGDHARPEAREGFGLRHPNPDAVRMDDDGGIEGRGSGL